MKKLSEKRQLQTAIILACIVPLAAGFSGMLKGVALLGSGSADLDNHFRYLSGLLFAIGLGFLSTVPHIERHAARVRLLTFIVVIGGLGRLYGFIVMGMSSHEMLAALAMELIVTPLLCLWQSRIASNPHS